LLVLHALRLASVAPGEVVASRSGLESGVVTDALVAAESDGWVVEHRGTLRGWALTAVGREELGRLLAEELDAAGVRRELESSYAAFLRLNGPFLELCTDWQLRRDVDEAPVPNDHSDAAHDAAVIARLEAIHREALVLVNRLAAGLGRFGGYRGRFEHAWGRLQRNDVDWFTRPLIDSYHTIWFELHEDLLATLGRTRTDEQRGA